MSVPYYGDFAEDDTVNLPFNTFDSNDPSNSVTATDLIASDIFVHKDGSATAITTDGASIDIDAPGVGAHMITIDTSADAAYSTGSEYAVRINGVTVDGGTVNAWIGAFSIERAGGVLAIAKLIQTAVIANAAGADIAADIIAVKAETVLIVADTGELQADDTPTAIAAVQTVVDKIPLSDGTVSWNATALAAIEAEANDALEVLQLDHLLHVADASTTTNNSIIAKMVSKSATAAFSSFVNTTDSLEATRDHIGDGTNLAEAGGTGDHLTAINLPNQTMDIVGNITGNLSGSVGSVTGAVGSLTGHTVQTGDTFALANGAAGFVAIDTVVDNILVDTAVIGALGAGLTDITDRLPAALVKGTADSGTTTTVVDAARTEATDDWFKGQWIRFTSTTLDQQMALITGFTATSDTITFTPAVTTAVVTHTYEILPANAVAIDWGQVLRPTTALDLSSTDIQLCDTITTYTGNTVQTGDTFALANGATGFVAIDTVVDTILVDTAAMQPLVAKIPLSDGSITWNATALGSINTQVDTALTDIHLDHLMAVAAADVIVDGSVIAHMVSTTEDWSTFVPSTDSLQSIRAKQTDIETDTAQIGAAGAGLTNINLPNQTMDIVGNITGNLSGSIGSNIELGPTEIATELATYDGPTNTEMEARTPTAAQLAYIVANAATGVPVTFTTSGGSTTAAVLNQVDSAGASATDDQYNGRLLVFNLGTLKEVVTDITDYDGGTLTATITAIPFAPTSSHTARLI